MKKRKQYYCKWEPVVVLISVLWFAFVMVSIFFKKGFVLKDTDTIAYSENIYVCVYYILFSLLYALCCMFGTFFVLRSHSLRNPHIKSGKSKLKKEMALFALILLLLVLACGFCYAHCIFDRYCLKMDGSIERCSYLAQSQVLASSSQYDDVEVAIVSGRGGPATGVSFEAMIQIASKGRYYRFDYGQFASCRAMLDFIQSLNYNNVRFTGIENLERFLQSTALSADEEQQWNSLFQMKNCQPSAAVLW